MVRVLDKVVAPDTSRFDPIDKLVRSVVSPCTVRVLDKVVTPDMSRFDPIDKRL
jgi:phosphoribosylaminoimidazole-succinocarboxamide synthase